jgi:hypothetical protein
MLALVNAVSTLASVRPPVWRMKPVPPRAAHLLASLGGESSKPKPETKVGLRSAVFGGVNTVRSRSNLEDGRVPSAPTIIQTSKPKMGVRVSKEVSVTILEACTAAEQAGEQQLDKAGTPTSHVHGTTKFFGPAQAGPVLLIPRQVTRFQNILSGGRSIFTPSVRIT